MAPTRRARPRAAQRAAQRARRGLQLARSASQILQEPLPPLEKGPHMTTSSAIHDTIFVGKLGVWSGFEVSVRQAIDHRQWTNVLFPYVQTSEYVHVGDEHGVQGRFEERVGQVLSHISYHQSPSFVFGDSKCVATTALSKTPDFIVMNGAGNSIIVGEIKTPWVLAHDIKRAVHRWQMGLSDNHLRKMLGQIAKYMDLLSLKYGVLTTYDQVLFLRQTVVGGEWTLQISPVKCHDDTSSTVTATVRECFWHVGQIALQGAGFNRTIGASFQGQIMPWTIN